MAEKGLTVREETSIQQRQAGQAMVADDVGQSMLERARTQLEVIEAGFEVQARLAQIAMISTNDADWDDIGGRKNKVCSGTPRLNARGAKKVRRICQLQVETFSATLVEEERDEHGRLTYFAYECRGRVSSQWAPPMDCVGRCDSMNKFHSTRYEWDHGQRTKKTIPAYEVNRTNIAQQAQTLCITRGVTQYMGLERLTWDEVKAATSAKQARTSFLTRDDSRNEPPPIGDPTPPSPNLLEKVQAFKRKVWDAKLCQDEQSWNELIGSILGESKVDPSSWTKDDIAKLENEIDRRAG